MAPVFRWQAPSPAQAWFEIVAPALLKQAWSPTQALFLMSPVFGAQASPPTQAPFPTTPALS